MHVDPPPQPRPSTAAPCTAEAPPLARLWAAAARTLACADVDGKLQAARVLQDLLAQVRAEGLDDDYAWHPLAAPRPRQPMPSAGRPPRPTLVHPARVSQRGVGTLAGRAALVHAVAHIEFNAINLACDALCRFPGLPPAYYTDWARVATEEAMHFSMLRQHLRGLDAAPGGHGPWDYGSFDAHDGLWAMAGRTADDPLARMALVPRVLEARGLDVTPQLQSRLRAVGTPDAQALVEILDVILRDEVGHVEIGNRWYRWLCDRAGKDPLVHDRELARQYDAPRQHGPFNRADRRAAGFTDAELNTLGLE